MQQTWWGFVLRGPGHLCFVRLTACLSVSQTWRVGIAQKWRRAGGGCASRTIVEIRWTLPQWFEQEHENKARVTWRDQHSHSWLLWCSYRSNILELSDECGLIPVFNRAVINGGYGKRRDTVMMLAPGPRTCKHWEVLMPGMNPAFTNMKQGLTPAPPRDPKWELVSMNHIMPNTEQRNQQKHDAIFSTKTKQHYKNT